MPAESWRIADLGVKMKPPRVRTGIGYDIHPLKEGRPLILGGVEIPFPKGPVGHSDADVLCHAIADAMLGAAGDGDIGTHFPSTDPEFRGISSLILLKRVAARLHEAGMEIVNIDSAVIAQSPKLKPYIQRMRSEVAHAIGLEEEAVNIKAKSAEGMDSLGREESIAAHAVCTILKG